MQRNSPPVPGSTRPSEPNDPEPVDTDCDPHDRVGDDVAAAAALAHDDADPDGPSCDEPFFEEAYGDEPGFEEPRADDRRATMPPPPPAARRLVGLVPIVLVSLAVHVALFVFVLQAAKEPYPIAQQQETPVEIVQEAKPPEPKPPEPKPPDSKTADLKTAEPETAKPETATAVPTPKPPDPDQPKPDVDREVAKPDLAKQDLVTQELAKQDSVTPEPMKPEPAQSDDAKTLETLQAELAALKAQQADLRAEQAARAAPSPALGPLPDSFRAVALPAESLGGEDSVSYEQAVFSLLAKAKKADKSLVVTPGVAQVVFDVDAEGNLIAVTLARSSGNAYLDDESLAIVRRAAPFPPPPQGALRHFSAAMRLEAER